MRAYDSYAGFARGCSAALFALATLASARALAFSDPETFQHDVAEGGGGGRFFTGAPADGYTCKVCHTGAPSPEVQLSGLPLDGYTPDTAYEITIDWADQLDDVALAFELNDANAASAGELRLPPESELLDPERCVPVSAGIAAGTLIDAPKRTILEVPNCGAQRVRFLWIAPGEDRGPIWFAGSFVRADGKSDAAGDGVTNFAGLLPSPSHASAVTRAVTAGCATLPFVRARGGRRFAGVMLTAIAVVLARARRRAVRGG